MSFISFSTTSCLISVLWFGSSTAAQRKPDFTQALNVSRVSAPLTNTEKTLSIKLAEQALRSKRLITGPKIYLTEAHIHRDTPSEMKGVFERLAVLTYYRYEGQLAIQVFINLGRKQVMAVNQVPKLIPPISDQEFTLAKQMAMDNLELRDVLGPYRNRLIVEALPSRAASPKDPLFRHRIVYLMFRVGPKYLLRESSILADLTTEKIIIEKVSTRMPM